MSYAPPPVTYAVSSPTPCWCNCADGCGDNCSVSCCEGCQGCYNCNFASSCCVESTPGRCHMTITIIFSVLSLIALILYIVATATREWTTGYRVVAGPYTGVIVKVGLWSFCPDSPTLLGCGDLDGLNYPGVISQSDSDVWRKVQTVRAFSLLAIFFTFAAWMMNFFFMCRYVLWLKWLVLSNGFFGVFSGLIAMSVWVSLDNDLTSGGLGYSLGLEAAAWPLLFIACILLWFVDYGVVIAGFVPPVAQPPALPPMNTGQVYPAPGFAAPFPTTSYAAAYSQPYSQPY